LTDDDVEVTVNSVNSKWPTEAHYVPLAHGARALAVLSQPEPMKKTLRAAFRRVTGDTLFVSAYPTMNYSDGQGYQKSVLYDCAKNLRYKELAKRFKLDDELVRVCSSAVRKSISWQFFYDNSSYSQLNSRISCICTRAKEFTDKKVEGFYHLIGAEECKKRVSDYTKNINYIYPEAVGFSPLFYILL
jgi:hypothetical protein